MGVDIRLPIGGLFTALGAMLIVYGFMTRGAEMYQKSLGYNVNLSWGFVMLVFGVIMLVFAIKGGKASKDDGGAASPERKERVGSHH